MPPSAETVTDPARPAGARVSTFGVNDSAKGGPAFSNKQADGPLRSLHRQHPEHAARPSGIRSALAGSETIGKTRARVEPTYRPRFFFTAAWLLMRRADLLFKPGPATQSLPDSAPLPAARSGAKKEPRGAAGKHAQPPTCKQLTNGRGWIRTNEGVSQRVYSPSPLATRAHAQTSPPPPAALTLTITS